jgi:uracil-DNA glycosylase
VDASEVFGTNCVKFATADLDTSRAWLRRELRIVQPRLLVVMGEDALAFVDELAFPLSRPLDGPLGELQRFTPTIEALVVPDIDSALDEQAAKTRFWNAFKQVGPWWAALPPY